MNARSIANKTTDLEHLLISQNPDVLLLTETWLHNEISDSSIFPPAYKVFRWDRDTRGGGVAIIVKRTISTMPLHCTLPEMVWCRITYANKVYLIGTVYRPPSTSPKFLDDLNCFLNSHVNENTRLIMAGDFNLPHINWENLSTGQVEVNSTNKLMQIMFSHNLNQIVKEFTRVTAKSQSVLDLIFISGGVADYTVSIDEGLSDHKMVCLNIPVSARASGKPYELVHVKDYGRADDTSTLDVLESRLISNSIPPRKCRRTMAAS